MSVPVQPKGWPRPRGSANGITAAGRFVAIGGQVGGKPPSMAMARGMVAQFAQAIDNVVAVTRAAGGAPTDIVSLTVYVTDLPQYLAGTYEIETAWREQLGDHNPTLTLVEVKALLEPEAVVEIQGFAVIESTARP